eukprot:364271-Chlamydomonas_euryale.AAC.14
MGCFAVADILLRKDRIFRTQKTRCSSRKGSPGRVCVCPSPAPTTLPTHAHHFKLRPWWRGQAQALELQAADEAEGMLSDDGRQQLFDALEVWGDTKGGRVRCVCEHNATAVAVADAAAIAAARTAGSEIRQREDPPAGNTSKYNLAEAGLAGRSI